MKATTHLLCLIWISFAFGQSEQEALAFQKELNLQFTAKKVSPLLPKDRLLFASLLFYDWNPDYCVTATIEKTPDAPLFLMESTDKRSALYQQYAIAHFVVLGKKMQLSLYQSQASKYDLQYRDHLFLPFKDLSNGDTTYHGGRYLNVLISELQQNTWILDFNKSFNPYCAYNPNYSCPIPPSENHLAIAIEAGVRNGIVKKP